MAKRRLRRRTKFALGLLLSLAAITAWVLWRNSRPEVELQREIARLRELGVPTTYAEIESKLPSGRLNAAPLLRLAIAERKRVPLNRWQDFEKSWAKLSRSTATPEEASLVRSALSEVDVVRILRKAAQADHCNWDRQWALGQNLLFPEAAELKYLTKILVARAYIAVREGRPEEAVECFRLADRLADFMAEDPILLGTVAANNMRLVWAAGARDYLRTRRGDSAALQLLSSLYEDLEPLPSMERSFDFETVETIRSPLHGGLEALIGDLERFSAPRKVSVAEALPFARKEAHAKIVRAWRRVHEVARERYFAHDAFAQGFKAADQELAQDKSVSGVLAYHRWFDYSPSGVSSAKPLAERRLAQCSIRLLLEFNRTGTLPARLPDWGELSTDPFTRKPFGYRRNGDGFVLYSELDDGDQGGDPTLKTKPNDLVWEIK